MRQPYTVRQRILGFGCVLLILFSLGACGKMTEKKAAEAGDNPTAAVHSDAPEPSTAATGPEETAALPSAPATREYEPAPEGIVRDEAGAFPGSAFGEYTVIEGEVPAYAGDLDGPSAGPVEPDPGPYMPPAEDAAPFVLTAGEWNDNANWPFFVNLVRSGAISFPVFGIDPTNRVQVTARDEAGAPLANEPVTLFDAEGKTLWTAQTGKDGVAYLFFRADQTPDHVTGVGAEASLSVSTPDETGQGTATVRQIDEITLTGTASAVQRTNLQVMFIVDTTGSMGDELVYLQKDFSSIAGEIGAGDVSYSVCFYRDECDEYVTRCYGFSSDVAAVQALINAEYADGGGDTPEAVAQILTETLADSGYWAENSEKLAFLIFDAPPHAGTDEELDRAIRAAAAQGIHVVPVVASNADRETELFGRALAICTDGTYVFLTDDSGVGGSHLEPIIGNYDVEKLHDVIIRIINSYRVN